MLLLIFYMNLFGFTKPFDEVNQFQWKLFQTYDNKKENSCSWNIHLIAILTYSLLQNRSCSYFYYFWNALYAFIHVYIISSKSLRFLYGHDAKQIGLPASGNAMNSQPLGKSWHIQSIAFTFATYTTNELFIVS